MNSHGSGETASVGGAPSDETPTLSGLLRAPSWRWAFPVGLALSLALLAAASAADGGFLGIGLSSSADEAIALVCPGPDACWYLTSGRALLDGGLLPPDLIWIWNLWPPGVSVVSASYVAASRIGIPVSITASVLAIAGWTAVLTAWRNFLSPRTGVVVATIAVLTVAWGQVMRGWYLGDGLFYVDSLSALCILASLLFLARSAVPPDEALPMRTRINLAAIGGAFYAAAAYLRTTVESGAALLSIMTVLALGGVVLVSTWIRPTDRDWRVAARPLVPLLAFVGVFHALTVPWRIFASRKIRPGDFGWSTVADFSWQGVWMPNDYLTSIGAGWLIEASRNTPCIVDPERCAEISAIESASSQPYAGGGLTPDEFRSEAIGAFLRNPLEWIQIKLETFPHYWFDAANAAGRYEFLENGLLLLGLVALLTLGLRRFGIVVYLFTIALVLATFVPVFIFHYESRYFFPLKSAIPLLAAWAVFGHRDPQVSTDAPVLPSTSRSESAPTISDEGASQPTLVDVRASGSIDN